MQLSPAKVSLLDSLSRDQISKYGKILLMPSSISDIKKYVRAANYLTVAQIFLQGNYLTNKDLGFDDIKPRLLGHWGTGPGINFVYAHLNHLIKKHDLEMMFVLGPGHGFPALQANLFLENSLASG